MIYRIYGNGRLVDMATDTKTLKHKVKQYESNPYISVIKITEATNGYTLETEIELKKITAPSAVYPTGRRYDEIFLQKR